MKYPKGTFKFPKLLDGVSRGALQGHGEAFGIQVDGRELWGSLVDLVRREPVLVIAVLGSDPDFEPPAALRGFEWTAEVAAGAGAVDGHGWAVQVSPPLLTRLIVRVLQSLPLWPNGVMEERAVYSGGPPLERQIVVGSRDRY